MKEKSMIGKAFYGIIVVAISLIFLNIFMQEFITKFFIGFGVIIALVIMFAKGLEINGMSDIFAVILLDVAPVISHFFSDITFIRKVTNLYMRVAQYFCQMIGKDIVVNISGEMGFTITIIVIFGCFEVWNCTKDRTAMKILHGSKDEELKEKSFTEKSEMFCKTLHQWLYDLNREANWNESQFTPLEAEVEMDNGGKRKKKYEDLLKCLKSNRRRGTVYLVLGSPGAGKSVSMRKLCLDLLKESKKTKKIPVYINLKEWNEDWNLDHLPEKRDLEIFIRKTFETKADFSTESFLDEYFQRMLEDGRWYFIFDSFDEMPCLMGKKNCQELIDKISALLYQFMTGPNQSGGVVASRLYKAPSSAVGASVTLKIQEFSDIKIKAMLKKYLVHYEDVTKLLFDGREDLVALCRNPFYLALLSNYISDRGNILPKNQMELYHSFIDGRLKKCKGKLEKENLRESEVYLAAKQLASFMQEKDECGLECPTSFFYQRENEAYWRKVFSVLKYAKICRLGGQDETISFVHRRFQEFFLVENIIEQKQEIEYEYYRDILSDAGLRDALVLYCEVAEEEKAIEIAEFCWKTIQTNIKFEDNIHTKEGQELVRVLYFMREAFRNRKQVLSNFNEEFYQLVKKVFDETNKEEKNVCVDYVIMLALVNSMILFSSAQLKSLVLRVFQMRNRWMNDIIMQNCRTLDTLDYHIENEFVRYFAKMNVTIFMKRFMDMQFSLSMSKKFKYVKKMHIMTMVLNMTCMLLTIPMIFFVTMNLSDYFFSGKVFQINIIQNSIQNANLNVKNNIVMSQPMTIVFVSIIFMLFAMLCSLFLIPMKRFFHLQCGIIWVEISLGFVLLNNIKVRIIGITELVICTIVALISITFIYVHDLKFYLKNRNLAKKVLLNTIRIYRKIILPMTLYFGFIFTMIYIPQKILTIILSILLFVIFVRLICLVVYCGFRYLKDCMWIRKNIAVNSCMQRKELENILGNICFNRLKYKYVDMLLLQHTELIGEWTDTDRPQYRDDRVNHILAKLDCIKLDSCDYLF